MVDDILGQISLSPMPGVSSESLDSLLKENYWDPENPYAEPQVLRNPEKWEPLKIIWRVILHLSNNCQICYYLSVVNVLTFFTFKVLSSEKYKWGCLENGLSTPETLSKLYVLIYCSRLNALHQLHHKMSFPAHKFTSAFNIFSISDPTFVAGWLTVVWCLRQALNWVNVPHKKSPSCSHWDQRCQSF